MQRRVSKKAAGVVVLLSLATCGSLLGGVAPVSAASKPQVELAIESFLAAQEEQISAGNQAGLVSPDESAESATNRSRVNKSVEEATEGIVSRADTSYRILGKKDKGNKIELHLEVTIEYTDIYENGASEVGYTTDEWKVVLSNNPGKSNKVERVEYLAPKSAEGPAEDGQLPQLPEPSSSDYSQRSADDSQSRLTILPNGIWVYTPGDYEPLINVTAMTNYALQWTNPLRPTRISPPYRDLQNNCANFASQTLRAGGWQFKDSYMAHDNELAWDWDLLSFRPTVGQQSLSWGKASHLYWFVRLKGGWPPLASAWDAQAGDLLFVDWEISGPDGTINHVMVVDSRIFSMPYISQQSTERHHISYARSLQLAAEQGLRPHWYGVRHQ